MANIVGKFNARAEGDALVQEFKTGTKAVTAKFKIIDGPKEGCVYAWKGMLSDKSQERTYQSLIACGCTFPGDDPMNFVGIGTNIVQVTVEDDPQYGLGIAWVDPAGGSVREENIVTGAAKKALGMQLKGTLLALKGGRKPSPAAAQAVANPFANNDAAPPAVAGNDAGAPLAATGTYGGTTLADDEIPF